MDPQCRARRYGKHVTPEITARNNDFVGKPRVPDHLTEKYTPSLNTNNCMFGPGARDQTVQYRGAADHKLQCQRCRDNCRNMAFHCSSSVTPWQGPQRASMRLETCYSK